mgnify:CR=1 FL=1
MHIKKDIIGHTSTYITLCDQRRIAVIKPGISPCDALNKSQMEEYTKDQIHKLTTNLRDPVNPQDVIILNFFNSNRTTKVYLTWKGGEKSNRG